MHFTRLLATALLLASAAAHAQYVWVDAHGVRHFADRPPPPDVPPAKILKAPSNSQLEQQLEKMHEAATAAAAPKPAGPAAGSEKEKLTVAESVRAQEQARCAAARAERAQLESNQRLIVAEPNGKQHELQDAERARRLADAEKALAACQ
jgi:hypothetical protein